MIDEKKLYQQVGKRIRERREQRGLTQLGLARQLRLERTSITNIEQGNQKTSLLVLYQICFCLKLPIDELLPSVQKVLAQEAQVEEVMTVGSKAEKVPPKAAALIKSLPERLKSKSK